MKEETTNSSVYNYLDTVLKENEALQASNEQLRKAFEELLLQTEDPTYWRKRAGLPDKQTKG